MLLREQISTRQFLKNIIREYYRKKPLEEPSDLHKREIALESLEDLAYIRHLSFPYMEALYNYILSTKTPLHLYYSSALYTHPSAPRMEDKLWEGSELLFDIDADKYPDCSIKYWICPDTGSVYSEKVEKCERSIAPIEYTTVPWKCIERAWSDILKLVEILREDFAFKNIRIFFSGNRGFHVKVTDSKALLYDRDVRRAIAEYVSCSGLDPSRLFPSYREDVIFTPEEYGLRKRVLKLAMKRNLAVRRAEYRGLRDIYIVKQGNIQELLSEACIDVDKSVTMDISRLSRFVGSLNMKAGLRVVELNVNQDISKLSFRDFSPFKGAVKVKFLFTAKLPVLDTTIEASKEEVRKVNSYIAIYLISKGVAVPVDTSDFEVST